MKTSTRLIMGAGFYRIGQIPAYMLSRCTIGQPENEKPLEVQTTPHVMMEQFILECSINFNVSKIYIKTH